MPGQRGFSLVEVLMAITVLMVGLAALARLSLVGIADTVGARDRSQAIALVTEAAEAVAFSVHDYATWSASPSPSATFSNQFAADWALRVADRLPGGQGAVCRDASPGDGEPGDLACDGGGPFVVKVAWRTPAGAALREVAVLP